MGAPKQKWTPEEEAALKAGVLRHGQGKWRTILMDPEFSVVLYLRSNVDLKDKWRNMCAVANGLGSREKARLAVKSTHQTPKQDDESPTTLANVVAQSVEDASEPKPVATVSGSPRAGGSRKSIIRLDNLIMDAINNLKEPDGSNRTSISAYIEDQYWAPPDFKRLLSAKLKYLTATGNLVKKKRKYRIATTLTLPERRRKPPILLLEGGQKLSPKPGCGDIGMLTKPRTDSELSETRRSMTREEAAAAAAARAVAEAEVAIAEAEQAAREAEAAEAEAEAAQAFAEAAMKTLQWRAATGMMIRA